MDNTITTPLSMSAQSLLNWRIFSFIYTDLEICVAWYLWTWKTENPYHYFLMLTDWQNILTSLYFCIAIYINYTKIHSNKDSNRIYLSIKIAQHLMDITLPLGMLIFICYWIPTILSAKFLEWQWFAWPLTIHQHGIIYALILIDFFQTEYQSKLASFWKAFCVVLSYCAFAVLLEKKFDYYAYKHGEVFPKFWEWPYYRIILAGIGLMVAIGCIQYIFCFIKKWQMNKTQTKERKTDSNYVSV